MLLKFALLTLGFAAVASSSGQVVDNIVPSNPTRSGLVRIYGSNLGNEATDVLYFVKPTSRDGSRGVLRAHIARWTPSLIECYVPEDALLGPTQIVLWRPGSPAQLGGVDIQARSGLGGRLRWRFQCADQYIIARPAIGPDGTVYAMGNYGHVYALTPDGALKWVRRPAGGVHGCINAAPDGTIYFGGSGINAMSPQGQMLWHHPIGTSLIAGPSLGPDGRIYAVDNTRWSSQVQGLVALNSQGQVVSSGGVFYARGAGNTPQEMQFDTENLYFWSEGGTGEPATPGLSAHYLGGSPRWLYGDAVGMTPAAYPGGGVVSVGTSTIDRFAPGGTKLWSRSLWDFGGYQVKQHLVAGPEGNVYFLASNARLNSINASGAIRFSQPIGEMPSYLEPTPDGQRLLMQTQANFGQPSHIRAYDSNGGLVWQSENLPTELGTWIAVSARIAVAPDSATAFFGTSGPLVGANAANCYVYRIGID